VTRRLGEEEHRDRPQGRTDLRGGGGAADEGVRAGSRTERFPAEVAEVRPGTVDAAALGARRGDAADHAALRSGIYLRLAFGTALLSGSVSKYASWAKLKKEAMKLVGIDWIALLYVITESL
jgi:hypothetical protein